MVHKVHDLIDEHALVWNLDIIEGMLNERDKWRILALPLSEMDMKDELTWALKNGLYTVKTAYMLAKDATLIIFSKIGLRFEVMMRVQRYVTLNGECVLTLFPLVL